MKARVTRVNNAPRTRGRPFGSGNPGRPKGAKNKITREQLQAARQAFTPLANLALEKGHKHLKDCKLDGCVSCQFWAKISLEYVYGRPTQPIEIDPVALRTELEAIAAAAGKSVEEIEAEAHELGVRVMADYGGATAR